MARNAIRALAITGFIVILWGWYGRSHFYRDPGSVFFDRANAFEWHYSAHRTDESTAFISQHSDPAAQTFTRQSAASSLRDKAPQAQMCIGIPTVKRAGLDSQYISSTVASALEGLTPQERASMNLSVYFADNDHRAHPDWNAPWVTLLADESWAFGEDRGVGRDATRAYVQEMRERNMQSHTKGTVDYTLVLERCLDSTEAPYIIVFEGDVLLARGWTAPTLAALSEVDQLVKKQLGDAADWLFVRMFNQERSTGWAGRRPGDNHELPIALGVDVLVLAVAYLLHKRKSGLSSYLDVATLGVLCLIAVPGVVVMFFQSGKASLLPPRDGLSIESFGCCSQALIFNRRNVPALIDYLRDQAMKETQSTGYTNYDVRTADFAKQAGLAILALYPVQAQHMGIKSALGTDQGEAQAVWSMAFESLTASKLEWRHSRAMSQLFGSDWEEVAKQSTGQRI